MHLVVLSVLALPLVAYLPSQVAAQDSKSPSATSIHLQLKNPLQNTNNIQDFLAKILHAVVLLLSPVIILMLVYTGFLFVRAQGSPEEIETARRTLLYTLIGAAIILGAEALAKVIQNTISQF